MQVDQASELKIINGVVGRNDDDEDRRYYIDPNDSELKYPSVTTVLGATHALDYILTPWAAKSSAQFAVDSIGRLVDLVIDKGPEVAVKWITGEAARIRDIKREIGTHQHNILEALLLDAPIPDCPEHLIDVEIDGERVDQDVISDGIVNFLSDYNPVMEMAEATVANTIHNYAGTLDCAGFFPSIRIPGRKSKGARVAVDAKTGRYMGDTARPQIVSYKNATEVWLSGPDLGQKVDMLEVDMCGVLHVRKTYKGGYKLYLIDPADESRFFAEFLASLETWSRTDSNASIAMKAFYPPLGDGSQPLPMIEDITDHGFGKFRNPLVAAGVEMLADLLTLSAAEVESVNGVGPAAIKACRAVLADYELAFAGEES